GREPQPRSAGSPPDCGRARRRDPRVVIVPDREVRRPETHPRALLERLRGPRAGLRKTALRARVARRRRAAPGTVAVPLTKPGRCPAATPASRASSREEGVAPWQTPPAPTSTPSSAWPEESVRTSAPEPTGSAAASARAPSSSATREIGRAHV